MSAVTIPFLLTHCGYAMLSIWRMKTECQAIQHKADSCSHLVRFNTKIRHAAAQASAGDVIKHTDAALHLLYKQACSQIPSYS